MPGQVRGNAVLEELRAETARLGERAVMQISPDQGTLLSLLVAATGARRALEVGTFTGMSALRIARALPPDGKLLACNVSAEWTVIGRKYWQKAGVADRIDLVLGPAGETLRALPREPAFDSIAGGRLYLREQDALYCYDVRKG